MKIQHALVLVSVMAITVGGSGPLALAGGPALTTIRVASGVNAPVMVTHAPDDFDRLFIVSQTGEISILKDGAVLPTPFLDIDSISTCCSERGLLGMAFHPNYQNNGRFFLHYSANNGDTTIARYVVSADPDVADAGSGQVLLTVDQPFTNHNGGWLGFSPNDNFLYISLGDGGSANDPGNRAQDGMELLGKILRIDVNSGPPYGIPADNPFVGDPNVLDEIWALGMRNPWRASFDRETGDFYIGDVGQFAREEIDFQPADSPGGLNYGWRCMEGFNCTGMSGCTCNDAALTLPIVDFTTSGSCAVIGGYVYRGCAIPDLQGTYFYAKHCNDQIWSLRYDGVTVTEHMNRTSELDPPGAASIHDPSGFGEDAAGELYICDLFGDEVFKIVPVDPPADCGISCDDIAGTFFQCNAASALKLGVFLTDTSHDGETVTFEIDGNPQEVTVVGQSAKLFLPGQDAGDYVLELTNPAGCFPAEVVTCN